MSLQILLKDDADLQIRNRTLNYNNLSKILDFYNNIVNKDEFILNINKKLNNSEYIYYYSIPAPLLNNINYSIKGNGFKYIYNIIKNTKIIFIWHNKDINCYELWSTCRRNLIRAIYILKRRINSAIEYHNISY
jgi:hypothetical protein